MVDMSKINAARESLVQMAPTPEAIKAGTLNTIHNAYSTLRGSGSVMTELGKVKDAYIDLPTGVAGTGLKACAELLTVQPINATCTLAKGLTAACGDIAKIVVSPIPTALAAAGKTLEGAKTVAKLPITVPMQACSVVGNGCSKMLDLFGSAPAVQSAAPTTGAPASAATAA